MEIKKFHSNINDNLDDVNLKIYEDDNEENSKDNQNKDSIEIIRRQEYLLQMKTEVKFPIYKILQKFNYIQDNEEYKLCSKIRIDSYKNNFIDSINDTNNILNINDNNNQILDISNEIFEEDLLTVKNNKQNNNFDESEECLTGYLFIFQDKIILTTTQIENLKKSLKNNPVLYSIQFSQFCIFRLIVHDTSSNELYLQFYDKTFSFKKDLMLKFLITRDSFCVHHFIKKYFILQWQIIFENTIILNFKKLIYNRHYILLKYNKYGKCQERTLLVTNGLLLNIKHDFKKYGLQFSLKNVQWAIGVKAIKKMIIMIEKKNENKLKLYLDKIINNAEVIEYLGNTKYLKYKQEQNFEFYSVDERNDFVGLIRRNYYMLTNKFIIIDSYPSLYNKNKTRSKSIIVSNNIFDSSFESSEEEQKINEKDNKKDENIKIEDKKEENNNENKNNNYKNNNNDNELKNEIKKEENISKINENENNKKFKEDNINNEKEKNNIDIINEKNKNENKNINININIINNNKKEIIQEVKNNDKKKNKIEEKKDDKIINKKIKENKQKQTKNQTKILKKTKKSIFDEKYNSIFDSDYESEEDN